MREGAGRLAGPHRRVDPVVLEEPFRDRRHVGRERAIGGEHRRLRLGPADGAVCDLGQRRVAVPVRQPLLAEPARLERVVAVREPRIGGAHRRHQRLHHLALDPVRQVPRVGDVDETAPAVGDLLVLGEDIGDQRKDAQVLLEGLGQRLRRRLAPLLARILHQIERRLDGERLLADLEAQARDGLVEQPVPGRVGGHRLLVKELLDAILELIGLVLADVLEPRPVVAERGIAHRRVELGIVEPVELEHEEQEMRGGGRHALLHVGVEFGARGIDRVAGADEVRVGFDAPTQIAERFVALHRLGERAAGIRPAGNFGQPALVGLLEGDRLGIDAIEIALHARIIDPRIEVVQVPFRQRAEACGRTRLGGVGGSAFCWCWHRC